MCCLLDRGQAYAFCSKSRDMSGIPRDIACVIFCYNIQQMDTTGNGGYIAPPLTQEEEGM
jgi:hypothetical protein